MTMKELRDFIFENYYSQIGFTKYYSYCSIKRRKRAKLIEKVLDTSKTK